MTRPGPRASHPPGRTSPPRISLERWTPRFVEGTLMRVLRGVRRCPPAIPRPTPRSTRRRCTAKPVTVYETDDEGWAWGQLGIRFDTWAGCRPSALIAGAPASTHRVNVLRTFVYPGPSMKLPPLTALSLGSTVQVARIEGDFAITAQGAIFAAHLAPARGSRGGFRLRRRAVHRRPIPWAARPASASIVPASSSSRCRCLRHRRPARQRHAVCVARRDAARRCACCGAATSCSGRAISA